MCLTRIRRKSEILLTAISNPFSAHSNPQPPTLITPNTVLHPQLEDPIIIHRHPPSSTITFYLLDI